MSNEVDALCERVYWMLSDCLSEDGSKRKRGEEALRQTEEHSRDFFAACAMICTASDEHAPPRVRWLAAVVAKNAMPRSWRPRVRRTHVTEEEREFVRGALLGALAEPHATIAAQIALWIARIARLDYPSKWPQLMPTMVSALTATPSPDAPHATLHALRAAAELFSALASRRLTQHRNAFFNAAPDAFNAIRGLFTRHVGIVLEAQARDADAARRAFEIVDLSMKCLRILLMHGFPRVDDRTEIVDLFSDLIRHPHLFMRGADRGTEVENRLSLLAAKLVARTFERHPLSFRVFMPQFLDVYWRMLVQYNRQTSDDEICAQAAHYIQCVLVCPAFNFTSVSIAAFRENTSGNMQQSNPELDDRTKSRNIVLAFFTQERVDALIEAMLTKIFVLRDEEAATWKDDPEAFNLDDETAEWGTHSLRVSCDEIFKTLLIRDKRRIAPKVIALAEAVPADQPLLRDACYRAVGNAVYELEGLFDFEPWLQGQLGPILQAPTGDSIEQRVLQSRAAWLVGQFVIQLTRDSRKVVYALLVNLVSRSDGDRVVALSSAQALFNLAEDLGFEAEDFLPHLRLCVESCFKIILTSETLETRRSILTLIGVLVRHSTVNAVVGLLPVFTEAMPMIWQMNSSAHGAYSQTMGEDDSAESNMLKTSLVVLCNLVLQTIGHWAVKNENMCRFVHEAVAYGTDLDEKGGGIYLSDDACDLWKMYLACAVDYNKAISDLFFRTPGILKDDSSRLKDLAPVIESYALLGGAEFMQTHGNTLLTILKDILGTSRDRGCLAVGEIVDLLLQLFRNEAVQYLRDMLKYMFDASIKEGQLSQILSAAYGALIARAVVVDVEGVEGLVLQGSVTHVDALFKLLLGRHHLLHRPKRRQLVVLALCFLMVRYKEAPQIRAHVPAVLNAAVDVMQALKKKNACTEFSLANVARYGEAGNEYDNPKKDSDDTVPENVRRRKLLESDPTRNMRLGDAVKSMVNEIRALQGGETMYQSMMHDTGQDTLARLETLIAEESARAR